MQAKFVLVKLCNSSFIKFRGSEILKDYSICHQNISPNANYKIETFSKLVICPWQDCAPRTNHELGKCFDSVVCIMAKFSDCISNIAFSVVQ